MYKKNLVNALHNFESGFFQLIAEPTRVCNTSESGIDLIAVFDHEKVRCPKCWYNDQLIPNCSRKVNRAPVNKHNTQMRCSKHYSKDQFIQNLPGR